MMLDERVDGFIWVIGLLTVTLIAGGMTMLAGFGAYTLVWG